MNGKIKIRIRPSALWRGWWYACFVMDKPRDKNGVVQTPVGKTGAHGGTPKEAYIKLQGRM